MSSTFTPDPGTLFYAASTIVLRETSYGDVGVAKKVTDRSYMECIFRCLAVDDEAVVGLAVFGYLVRLRPKTLFIRRECRFTPVGPEIAKALEISDE